ncbi:NADAR family protein [Streptodolium elevatio]|uniref:NADAR family protein n=1 Tax=Streptodolium elevatio TaxID=3157996 RepID=A0ABV3DAM1_9ACTN
MTELLRAKFRQHPDLADILVSTGDARIVYQSLDPFWDGAGPGETKRHWMGRLLELVRAELVLARSTVAAGDDAPGEPC